VKTPLALLMSFVAVFAPACHTTSESSVANAAGGEPLEAMAVEAWEAVSGGRAIGVVVRFEVAARPEEAWFSVRNPHQQELGLVDTRGRAWRYRPAVGDSDWIGTGTVIEGVAQILAASHVLELYEVPLATLLAEAPRPRAR
jgi:hypothetical protein